MGRQSSINNHWLTIPVTGKIIPTCLTMCSVQKWTPRTGAPKLNHWDGGQNMFNNTVEADQLATIVFLNWLVVWISTCSPVLLHGQWVGTLRVILYCIHIDKYIYIQYIRYAYMNSSGEQEWSALPWGRVKVKSQIEISCVVFGCLTFCSIVIPPKIYIYTRTENRLLPF